jgi:hypothetical protein
MIFKFLGLLRSDARQMWQLLMGEAEPVRLPPFVKSQKEAMARRLGAGGLTRLFDLAMDAELGIKSGAKNPDQAMEFLAAELFSCFRDERSATPPFFLVLPRLLGHFSHKSTGQDHAFGEKPLPGRKTMLIKESHPHYHGHRKRLKDRLAENPRGLAEYEVLELLLSYANPRRDNKPLAKALLARFGSLRGVFSARIAELKAVEGFGEGYARFWQLWREFWARSTRTRFASGWP